MADSFKDRLDRLAKEKGKTLSRVRLDAYDPNVKGTNPESLKRVISRERPLRPEQIAALAGAVGVPPEHFPEYRLALARRALDEREVGLDQAVKTLEQIQEHLAPARRATKQ